MLLAGQHQLKQNNSSLYDFRSAYRFNGNQQLSLAPAKSSKESHYESEIPHLFPGLARLL